METEQENLRKLAEIKTYLEEKIAELEREVTALKEIRELIDKELISKSFKKAAEQPTKTDETTLRRLRSRTGQLLATMALSENEIRIIINPEIKVTQDDRPFSSFLIKKILDNYVESDLQQVEEGKISPEQTMNYEVIYDNGIVREIIIRNYREEPRLREIINSIKWTLETISASK
ncbi:MAG TPA: hypothetical protein EYH45_07035 [Candidatus Caldiarchaeum subterraneum]|uniref:Uncharacterized protein n=1 Tax=Caldiarchaeum subterraneum TaxID=311458 RepID=A0A833EA98_CALS0|nr:hypothetical protein [Candidatus Caldarchaeum subterraneum]